MVISTSTPVLIRVCEKEIESHFNFLFSFMKIIKKKRAGDAKVPQLLNGENSKTSNDLNARIVVYYLPGITHR